MDNNSKSVADFLGLDKGAVEEVQSLRVGDNVVVRVKMREGERKCPGCGSNNVKFKEYHTRKLISPLFQNMGCTVMMKERRYVCRLCGKSYYEDIPLAAGSAKVTQEMVYTVLKKLQDYNTTFANVARDLRVSPTAVADIFDRFYNPKRERMPELLCIDECYLKGNFEKPYALVLFNWANGRIVDVLEGREKVSISKYLFEVPAEERERVEVVCIDMWETYLELSRRYFKNAIVVVDSFHVIKNMNAALDRVRCRVMNSLDRGSDEYHYLKKYHWTLFKIAADRTGKRFRDRATRAYVTIQEVLNKILATSEELLRAYEICYEYRVFNKLPHTKGEAYKKIDRIVAEIAEAGVEELYEFAGTLANWRDCIAESFEQRVEQRRVSNGPIEGFNSYFKESLFVTRGMANFQRFRDRLILANRKEIELSPTQKTRKRKGRKRGKYRKKKAAKNES